MMGADCPVCKLIRTYLLLAVPLLAFVAASTMSEQGSARLWFARVELIDILSWGSLAALVVIVAYRAYQEFYLPKSRVRALEAMKLSLEKQDVSQGQLGKESCSSDRHAESGKD